MVTVQCCCTNTLACVQSINHDGGWIQNECSSDSHGTTGGCTCEEKYCEKL